MAGRGISWPKRIAKNVVRTQLATNIDWFPTLASYCGLALPGRKIDGKDISRMIQSDDAVSPHENFYWQSGGSRENPQWAVRSGIWKLLHSPQQSDKNEPDADGFMLISLQSDNAERINLSTQHPEIVLKLRQQYQKWIETAFEQ